jgi:hypothetical protein
MPKDINQKSLVRELGITARRVRQLVEAKILPEAGEGIYDLAVCKEFYELYSRGSDRDWEDFEARILEDAAEVEKLSKIALRPRATFSQVVHAARASVQLWNAIRFCMAAARGVGDATKALTLRLVDYDERAFSGEVIAKIFKFKESDAQAFLASERRAEHLATKGKGNGSRTANSP